MGHVAANKNRKFSEENPAIARDSQETLTLTPGPLGPIWTDEENLSVAVFVVHKS